MPSDTARPLAGHGVASIGSAPGLNFACELLKSLGTVVTAQPLGTELGILDASADHDPVLLAAAGEGGKRPGDWPQAAELAGATERPVVRLSPAPVAVDWASSGAMALTGPPEGPPALSPGAPASALRAYSRCSICSAGLALTGIGPSLGYRVHGSWASGPPWPGCHGRLPGR